MSRHQRIDARLVARVQRRDVEGRVRPAHAGRPRRGRWPCATPPPSCPAASSARHVREADAARARRVTSAAGRTSDERSKRDTDGYGTAEGVVSAAGQRPSSRSETSQSRWACSGSRAYGASAEAAGAGLRVDELGRAKLPGARGRPPAASRSTTPRRGAPARRPLALLVSAIAETREPVHFQASANELAWPYVHRRVAGHPLRALARHLRHPARAHAGARQAGGGVGAARTPAPARRAAPDRPRVGDAAAARPGRLRRAGRRAGPPHPRGRRRAQRRSSAADPAHAGPPGRRGHPGRAGRGRRSRRPGGDRPHAAGGPWTTPLDEDDEHATYDPAQVAAYFAAATQAALVLAALRAPYRGRSTPVNAWWGTFDLAVGLFSGRPADPPSDDFIMRNARTPSRSRSAGGPATSATRRPRSSPSPTPRRTGSRARRCDRRRPAGNRAGRVHARLGRRPTLARPARRGPRVRPLGVRHACTVCGWDPALAASANWRS